MRRISSICVYCGSGLGRDPAYAVAADRLGAILAASDVRLVYGGGSVGLMGRVAHAALTAGGSVTGVIPQFLRDREVMLEDVDDLLVTRDMHERKRLMFERSDAFVALPGGIGTLEEVVEMMTWAQLGQHDKPIALLDVNGFWAPLVELIGHMKAEAFIREGFEVPFEVVDRLDDLLPRLEAAAARAAGRRVENPAVIGRM